MRTPSDVAAMLKLEQWGWSISRIAAAFAVDRKTVRRYVRAGCWMGYKPRERSSGALAHRGSTYSEIARVLGIAEGAVRYRAKRIQSNAVDGRTRRALKAASVAAEIDRWRGMQADGAINLAELHAWLVAEHGYRGSLRSVQQYWAQTYPPPWVRARGREADPLWRELSERPLQRELRRTAGQACNQLRRQVAARLSPWLWMHEVMQGQLPVDSISFGGCDPDEIGELLRRVRECKLADRNKALAVIASHQGISSHIIYRFLGIDLKTLRRYLRIFDEGGTAALFSRRVGSSRALTDASTKQAVFALLHEPPANHGINRTTWKMADLVRVLRSQGYSVCPDVVRKITKAAGYRWRKARTVLTSKDPDYARKLAGIRSILSRLSADEVFFSIDEFGPFAVKLTGGRSLMPPGEQRVVPQWQRSKGSLILTAALELSTNQVTHFYSGAKNTAEMIRMMDLLVEQYAHCRRLYLSWDAASWHISKRLGKHVEQHNAAAQSKCQPLVETAPLPAGAQFLNVIESVFSGMARAIIHNSDYGSLDDAKAAINRYYEERNLHFQQNPRRAGKKIWGKERECAVFKEGNNCKDPYYYR
jgi:transposase